MVKTRSRFRSLASAYVSTAAARPSSNRLRLPNLDSLPPNHGDAHIDHIDGGRDHDNEADDGLTEAGLRAVSTRSLRLRTCRTRSAGARVPVSASARRAPLSGLRCWPTRRCCPTSCLLDVATSAAKTLQ